MSGDPCICGPEPCKKCGYQYSDISLKPNAEGCNKCCPPVPAVKTLDVEAAWMMLCVTCPYCQAANLIDGNNTMGGFEGDALECHSCGKRAWLGEDAEADSGGDINNVDTLNKGRPV